MAGYFSNKYGIDPEDDSYLFGESQDPFSASLKTNALGGSDMGNQIAQKGTAESIAGLAPAAAGGALMGGPGGAAVMVGGQFLSQYLAQKAAEEQAKRQRAVDIERGYTKNMGDALSQKLAAYRSALR